MVTVGLAIGAFLIGRAAPIPTPDPIQTRAGVPVGVGHSPGGAVAAADNYLAAEQASVERDPQRFQALLSQDYAPAIKQGALADAAADRGRDPGGLRLWASGGRSFTVVGAHRLDWYRGDSAQVTTWAGQIFWGPGQAPCQAWALGRISLDWQRGRWRVRAMTTLPGPAPAPSSLPQVGPADDTSEAFDAQLGGFSPVSYGSPR
jgi:hypothetical protein